jgi:hypothetical protein
MITIKAKKIIVIQAASLIVLATLSFSVAHASEVTGNLSSSGISSPSGSSAGGGGTGSSSIFGTISGGVSSGSTISGTITGGGNGSSVSGSVTGGSGGGGNSSAPNGSVLGESTVAPSTGGTVGIAGGSRALAVNQASLSTSKVAAETAVTGSGDQNNPAGSVLGADIAQASTGLTNSQDSSGQGYNWSFYLSLLLLVLLAALIFYALFIHKRKQV